MRANFLTSLILVALLVPAAASGQKVYLNPSNQTTNLVSGGGNEAQYMLILANQTKTKLDACGFTSRVDQDFTNAPSNANSWGAGIFVSIHSNAGGGHGTESLYKTSGGKVLAGAVQNGLIAALPYSDRGLKVRTDLHVLNATNMYATLTEVVFHDCAKTSGFTGHPPSESSYLKSSSGQGEISTGISNGVAKYYSKTCTAQPKTGRVTGVVYKNPTLTDHIAGATVKVNTGASKVYDGTNVWYFDLPAGTYTLTATATGYKAGAKAATVTAGATTWASLGLDPVGATTGTLKGSVYEDPDTAKKIAATVELGSGAQAAYDGKTDFSFEVSPGSYSVAASAAGYDPNATTVTVVAGNVARADIPLKKAVAVPPDAGEAVAPPDAEAPDAEELLPGQDAGEVPVVPSDASAPAKVDAGKPVGPGTVESGCGCAAGGAGLALAMLPALLALGRRRRVR
ncbi:MAG TPA: N-acetylmuramoyl-L-alanine amidase [Myxococcales bacterium]|jgi:N-acetylmuramoyl-L-alanine amidase